VPQHALGHAGGAAGVPEEGVVARPFDARRRFVVAQQLFVDGVAVVVVDLDDVAQPGHLVACFVDPPPERTVVHEDFGVGVVDEEGQLVAQVPEVDVGRHRAQLRQREQALHVLGAVVEVERDVRVAADPERRERGGEARGPVLDVPVREAPVTLHDRRGVGDGVGDQFPDAGKALVHGGDSTFWRRRCAVVAHE